MSGIAMGVPRTHQHARFAARLRLDMERAGHTRASLAQVLGVTATMVGYWRAGRYLPAMSMLDRIVEALDDDAILRALVTQARTGRCPGCGATFDREQTRRRYCTPLCQRRAHLKDGLKADPRQDAIDAMCQGCEPTDQTCRDDGCALRPYSPFLFVARRA